VACALLDIIRSRLEVELLRL